MALVGTIAIGGVWSIGGGAWLGLLSALAGSALSGSMIWAVRIVGTAALRREAMGFGDVTLMMMVGAFLGPLQALLTIFVGSLVGAVIFGPIGLKTGKLVPFGVFLALGAAIVFMFGDEMIHWYATRIC